MKYHFFLATRWRNRDKALKLIARLEKKGFSVYNFFKSDHVIADIKEDPDETMKKFESISDWQTNSQIKQIFKQDLEGLQESEKFILLLPAGKSAHIEAGIAFGMGKKCILVGEQKEAESVYLIFSKFYQSVDEFLKKIKTGLC